MSGASESGSTSRRAADRTLTEAEVLALPLSFDVVTAGRAFGLGRTKTYDLIKAEAFPIRVLKYGTCTRRCLKADLLAALGIGQQSQQQTA